MLYQLPTGKVLYLSIEEYLSLNDRELHELANNNMGEEPSHSMYYGKRVKKDIKQNLNSQNDLDYDPDSEDTDTIGPINLDNLSGEFT